MAARNSAAPAGIWRTALLRPVRRAGGYAAFYLGLLLFGLFCLLWSIPASGLFRVLPRRFGARCGQCAIMAGFRLYLAIMQGLGIFRCDLSALDALRGAGPMIIAPNHPSLLDAVLVISRLPRLVCITKAGLWDNVFLGGGVRLAGYIRNDAPVALIRRAIAELGDGHQLLVFPEGTRTARPPLGDFKGGFLLMARRAGVPVQSVFIENPAGYLGRGWTLFSKPPLPLVLRVRLGERFDVPDDLQGFRRDLEQYYRSELTAGAAAQRRAA